MAFETKSTPIKKLDEASLKACMEILNDALGYYSNRLTEWEISFCKSVRNGLVTYGVDAIISPKQSAIIERIETKIYSTD